LKPVFLTSITCQIEHPLIPGYFLLFRKVPDIIEFPQQLVARKLKRHYFYLIIHQFFQKAKMNFFWFFNCFKLDSIS